MEGITYVRVPDRALYRAMDYRTCEWRYGWFVGYSESRGYIHGDYVDKNEFWTVSARTAGQYARVYDKIGRKVFEGDIVKIKYLDSEYLGKVVFSEKARGFEVWYNTKVGAYGEMATHKMNITSLDGVEVMGNIHENKSLLGL